jgi:hypothetical protein
VATIRGACMSSAAQTGNHQATGFSRNCGEQRWAFDRQPGQLVFSSEGDKIAGSRRRSRFAESAANLQQTTLWNL